MSDIAKRFSVEGKRALVTGASRGIGAEIAIVLADAGADVAIVGRDAEGLDATRQAVAKKGRQCVAIQADLGTIDGPRVAGVRALECFGTVDILVNNAGVFYRQSILETTALQWDETQSTNLRAAFLLAQVVGPRMIEQKRGKIINVSSVASIAGCEGHAAYSASKAGMNSLTQVMAAEWGPFNIQTNAIAPAIVLTDMARKSGATKRNVQPVKGRIPLHRFGEPIEIADLALNLASPASDFICGQVVIIDGGYSAV